MPPAPNPPADSPATRVHVLHLLPSPGPEHPNIAARMRAAMAEANPAQRHLLADLYLALAELDPQAVVAAASYYAATADVVGLQQVRNVLAAQRRGEVIDAVARLGTPEIQEGDYEPWEPRDLPPLTTEREWAAVQLEANVVPLQTYWGDAPTSAGLYDPPVTDFTGEYPSPHSLVVLKRNRTPEAHGPQAADYVDEATALGILRGLEGVPKVRAATPEYLVKEWLPGVTLGELQGHGDPYSYVPLLLTLAHRLQAIHDRGLLALDLQPYNVLSTGNLLDYGNMRRGPLARTFVMNPWYTAPEVWTDRVATAATDVWMLGVMAAELFAGEYPYVTSPVEAPADPAERSQCLRLSLAEAVLCGPSIAPGTFSDDVLARMLSPRPAMRPTLREFIGALEALLGPPLLFPPLVRALPPEAPLALVPMRAGVPHRGHLNLLRALRQLGYRPVVAMMKAFTWTEQDPLPKWQVAAVLREHLHSEGYAPEDFQWIYCPYGSRSQILQTLTGGAYWPRCKIIVSGNPGVWALVKDLASQCGLVRSEELCGPLTYANGTRLRAALRSGDASTVAAMGLEGTPTVTWPEEHEQVAVPLTKLPLVEVSNRAGVTQARVRLLPREGPAEALARHYRSVGFGVTVRRDASLTVGDSLGAYGVAYMAQEYRRGPQGHELIIHYRLK